MLSYAAKSLWRNPRRVLAAVAGVALAIALLTDAALFIDGSGRRMTTRAIAHVTVDMQAGVNSPLASSLSLVASVSPRPPLLPGQAVTVTLMATNNSPQPANAVILEAPLPKLLSYQAGSTARDGIGIPEIPPSEDNPFPPNLLEAGLPLGVLAPGASTTVTYGAITRQAVSSAAEILTGTIRSAEEPVAATANGPRAADVPTLAATIRALPDVRAAQPFALVDLPAGTLQVAGHILDAPVKLVGIDPTYGSDIPIVGFTQGNYAPATAFLSPAAAQLLGAAPGASALLQIPGRAFFAPLVLPISAVADLTHADQLFASRDPGSLGDFVGAPYVVGIDVATFQQQVLPALRVDAAAPIPILKLPPVLEIHAQVAHHALTSDPGSAFTVTSGVRRSIERAASGDITVIDNVSASLDRARTDSTLAKVLFIALGLPGSILAGYLAFYGGGLLAETERREQALLRARGFSPLTLARGLAYQTVGIAVLGITTGLAVALGVADALFPSEFTPHGRGFAIAIGLAVVVAVIVATLAIYLPGRRALRGEVTQGREALPTTGQPWWLRVRIDLVLLLAAAIVSAIFVVSGGFKPNPKAHDQSIARSFYVLLAPWCLWLGGTLLAARGFLALCSRIGSKTAPVDFRRHLVAKTLLRSISRRPRAIAAGIVALSLTVAFGVSLAIFVATFRSEQRADARFVVGSDVRVTPSLGQGLPADIATLLGVPGVHAISPVAQDPAVVLGTDAVLFAAVDPQTFERVAPLDDGFFTDTTAHAAMTALARDPHAVLMDKETALSFNVRKGDTVKAQIPSPSLGQPILVTFRVAGTMIQFPGFPLGLDLVGNLSAYQQETGTTNPSYFLLSTDGSPATNARVTHALTANLATTVPARIDSTAITSNKDQTSLAGLSLTGLGRFEGLYTLLIASLGTIILVAALLLQRGTERATMRALGLGRRRLQAVILGEAVIVIITSIAIGALLGAPMAYMFVQILRRIFVVPPTALAVPSSQALLLGGLLLVTVTLSAIIIASAIRRLRLLELLRTE